MSRVWSSYAALRVSLRSSGEVELEEQRESILEDLGRISGTMSEGNNNMKALV